MASVCLDAGAECVGPCTRAAWRFVRVNLKRGHTRRPSPGPSQVDHCPDSVASSTYLDSSFSSTNSTQTPRLGGVKREACLGTQSPHPPTASEPTLQILRKLQAALEEGLKGIQLCNAPPSTTAGSLLKAVATQGQSPPAVWGHAAVLQDSETLLVHGGATAEETVGEAFVLNLNTLEWEESATAATDPIKWHTLGMLPSMQLALLVGGEGASDEDSTPESELQCLDTSLGIWYPATTTGTGPSKRSGHVMSCIQSSVSPVQQNLASGTQDTLRRVLRASGLKPSPSAPATPVVSASPQGLPSSAVSTAAGCSSFPSSDEMPGSPSSDAAEGNERMVVHGGCHAGRWVNDVFCLEVGTYRWSKQRPTGSPPGPRSYHSLTAMPGGRMVLFGGNDDRQSFGDVHVLNTSAHPWAWSEPCVSGQAPCKRSGHVAVQVSPRHILIAGGWDTFANDSEPAPLGDAYLLDVEDWCWHPLGPGSMPSAAQRALEFSPPAKVAKAGASHQAPRATARSSARKGRRQRSEPVAHVSDFGVWAQVARSGAVGLLLGDSSQPSLQGCTDGDMAVAIVGGLDSSLKPCATTVVLPLPLEAQSAWQASTHELRHV